MNFFFTFLYRSMLYFFMRKLLIILLLATIATVSNISYVFSAEESAKITNEDAQNALKEVIADVKILDVRPAKIQGLWEIAVEAKGQKGIIYLDSSRNFAVFGSIIDLKTKTNLTQDRTGELNKVDVSTIPLDDALVVGEKDAKYRVIVFDDPD
jgi:thiol:disulfide interchange protein DsbC